MKHLIFSILLIHLFASSSFANNQPNVVVILADDIGIGDLNAYRETQHTGSPGSFQTTIPTPHLDSLARGGMMFTDAHTSGALCAPTRFSMMTGQYPSRNGVLSNGVVSGTWDLNDASAFVVNEGDPLGGSNNNMIEHKTLGEVMQAAGYRTSFFGKTNFGGRLRDANGNVTRNYNDADWNKPVYQGINDQGFDYSFASHSALQTPPHGFFENDVFAPVAYDPVNNPDRNNYMIQWAEGVYPNGDGSVHEIKSRAGGIGDKDWNTSKTGDWLSQKAVDYIDSHVQQNQANGEDKPLFMYYSSLAVHKPHTPPVSFDGEPVLNSTVGGNNPQGDMVKELDLQVGRILQKLEEEGMTNDTLFIFTSDNGGLNKLGDGGTNPKVHFPSANLREKKGSEYEGGHRVPFIAKWGDGTAEGSYIEPGTTTDQLIMTHDIAASLYDLTRQNMDADQAQDSTTILPILFGQQGEDEAVRDFAHIVARELVMRMDDDEGEWVLTLSKEDLTFTPLELFNLTNDISQENDLLNDPDQQDRIQLMRDLYLQYNDQNDPRTMPIFNVADATPIPVISNGGDIDGDGNVDGADFLELQRRGSDVQALLDWQANYNGNSLSAVSAQVPEPTTLLLLLIPIVGRALSRNRKSC